MTTKNFNAKRTATTKPSKPAVPVVPPTRDEQIADLVDGLYHEMITADRSARKYEASLVEYVTQHGAMRSVSEMEYALKYRAEANAWEGVREWIASAFDRVETWRAKLVAQANGEEFDCSPFRYYSDALTKTLTDIVMVAPASERDARTLYLGLKGFRDQVTEAAMREASSPSQIRAGSIRDAAEIAQRTANATVLRDELMWPLVKFEQLFGV